MLGAKKIIDSVQFVAWIFTQIFQVKIGAKADITSDALPKNLTGKVIEKGLLVERQNRVYDSPTAQTDNRVVKVVVELDKESSKIASSFSNLQVIAKIHVNSNSISDH